MFYLFKRERFKIVRPAFAFSGKKNTKRVEVSLVKCCTHTIKTRKTRRAQNKKTRIQFTIYKKGMINQPTKMKSVTKRHIYY